MKKIFYILSLLLITVQFAAAQKVCCPVISDIIADRFACRPKFTQSPTNPQEQPKCEFFACKNSIVTYTVYPKITGYTYQWAVNGGTANTLSGNKIIMHWGTAPGPFEISVIVFNGECRDTIKESYCLVDGPKANFDVNGPTTVCLNSSVDFTNTSIGATHSYWNFGDGTISTTINPSHIYTTPGTYNVVLTVNNESIDTLSTTQGGVRVDQKCGCQDTIMKTIIVKDLEPIKIEPGCKKMLCQGDTAEYCTPTNCNDYNWSVTGGTIIGSNKGKCISVVWNGSYPATVKLTGNCGAVCGNTATLNVPVLYPTMPINGAIKVCPSSTHIYSLPTMPGVFYTWKIVPGSGGSFVGPNLNTPDVTINWGSTVGTFKVTCDYYNPATKCSGKAELDVNVLPEYKVIGPSPICLGSSATYTANGVSTWTISPADGATTPSSFANGNSINVTWVKKGTYTITGTPTNPSLFCSYPYKLIVVVNDTPYVKAIIGPLKICPSSSQVYNATSTLPGGTFYWSINGSTGNSSMGLQQQIENIDWAATGPYKIKVRHQVNGCFSDYKEIELDTYKKPEITGPSPVCMDNSATYTTTAIAPAGDYQWSLGNALGTITAGNGTQNVTIQWHGAMPPAPSTCPVYLTTCGGKDTLLVTITSAPIVTITQTGSLCATSTLSATIAGATSYVWTLNGVAMGASFNTQTITITQHGIYTVTVSNAGGCKSKATFVVPKETPNFNVGIAAITRTYWKCNETINSILAATPATAGYCYQWFVRPIGNLGSGFGLGGATSPTYNATSVGEYWCEVRVCGTNCSKATDKIKVIKESCDTGGTCTPHVITSFTVSPCNPFTFTITTSPAAAASTIHWYFGDGKDTISGNTVTHGYKSIGTFKVCAIIGVSPYCRKDTCKDVTVTVAANFKAVANCNTVSFTNLSQSIAPISSYVWNFPGGAPSTFTGANPPVITYALGGLHWVDLTIISGACTVKFKDTIRTVSVDATLTIPTPICVNSSAPFSASSPSPGLNYVWNFGDGYTSNLDSTEHAYASAGPKIVTLTVTDPVSGCTKTITQTINVTPAISANIGTDVKMCMGSNTTLTAPSGFGGYQWYFNGTLIAGATSATYLASAVGEYWVKVSNGAGCSTLSNKIKVKYAISPVAKIIKDDESYCDKNNIPLQSFPGQGVYTWSKLSGPGTATFTPNGTLGAANPVGTVSVDGVYQIQLMVTSTDGCKSYDTLCMEVSKKPSVTITSPDGPLCEGKLYSFTAAPSPVLSPDTYSYVWDDFKTTVPTFTTGVPGVYTVVLADEKGCYASATTPTIEKLPNVLLFPQGCDTLCLRDTIKFPLPLGNGTNASSYNITWYENDGMTVTNLGTGFNLTAESLNTGDHHIYAEVTYGGGCKATTASFDVYIKDCTAPVCNDCPTILESSSMQLDDDVKNGNGFFIKNGSITFTTKKPLKSIKINVSELGYHWKDPKCNDCKVTTSNRGCLFPQSTSQTIGSLTLDNAAGSNIATATKECPNELVFKSNTLLPPGTYTVPFQITLPFNDNQKCQLILDKLCVQISMVDSACKTCQTKICAKPDAENSNCKCNQAGVWTNLYLVPIKPGIAKPKTLILCNTTISDYKANVLYRLSGMYNCTGGGCASTKNEVVITDQQTHIVYTRITSVFNETIVFPGAGYYDVVLTAYCGKTKCICKFKINVKPGDPEKPENPIGTGTPTKDPPISIAKAIDSVVNIELPPNFNGGILVTRNDSVLYEKYVALKDDVNNHTAFDIASITKTFTSMAILKLMENGKLKLDDPVKNYLTDFPKGDVTIKMLLSHTSGIEDYLKFMDESNYDKNKIMNNTDLYSFIKSNPNKVFVKNAGSSFDYSNTNFALLALVIEKISGVGYKTYMDNTFFKPLKMDDTYILSAENIQRRKNSYYKSGKEYPLRYLDLINGDKCVYTTVQDLRKWDKGLRTLFSKATIDLAYGSQSAAANTSNYALGWKTIKTSTGQTVWYHLGWWAGNRSMFIRLPKNNVMIAVMSNNNHTNIAELKKICDLFGNYNFSKTPIDNF